MSTVRLMAVGDISLQTRNTKHPFKNVRDVFKGKDILFGNLETVLSNQGEKARKAVVLHSPPEKVGYLKDAGFDILNIANNHILDMGVEGFNKTLKVLDESNLVPIGANDEPRQSHAILERQGIRFGFLGYYGGGFSLPDKEVWINRIELADIIRDIEFIRPKCDFIILSLHWGTENVCYPSPQQVEFAHKLIDSGANVILGHHSHTIQGIERYKHGLIAYSLGNFQFDPKISYTKTNHSMILCLNFSREGLDNYDIMPIVIDQDDVPSLAEENREEIINFVNKISEPVNDGTLTWEWWFEEVAGEYLSGNMRSFIIRIKRYGFGHFMQCAIWLISPFCLKCYAAVLRRRLRRKESKPHCA